MVNITHKSSTLRKAIAEAVLSVSSQETIDAIVNNRVPKGNVFEMAKTAGLFAAKKTSDVIPDCHPLPIEFTSIQFEIKDPDIGFVTIMDVEMTNDYSLAKLYVTFLDKEKGAELQLKALNGYAKQIRGALGKKLMIRKIPEIKFLVDSTFEQGKKIDDIIDLLQKQRQN